MTLNDTLSNALSHILNCERRGKKECIVGNVSRVVKEVLTIMKKLKYIEGFESTKTDRGEFVKIRLSGRINKCGVIKPRFPIKTTDFEKYEKRYLPAKDFGVIIISTPKGIMTHLESIKRGLGGRLLAYCY